MEFEGSNQFFSLFKRFLSISSLRLAYRTPMPRPGWFLVTLHTPSVDLLVEFLSDGRYPFSSSSHCGILMLITSSNRTGRYKRYVIFAVALSTASLFMITLRWRGHTNIFETGYIFPAGFGIGMLNTVLFVGLSASVKPEDQAIATSAFYLCDNLGYIGVSTLGNAVLQYALHERLHVRLANVDNASEVSVDSISCRINLLD